MDRYKIREFVRQAHPNKRIVTDDTPEAMATSDDRDVDVGKLGITTWKKLRPSPSTDARDKFRPRRLTGTAVR